MQSGYLTRIRLIAPYAIAAFVILFCALSTAYSLRWIVRSYHPALLWDQWDMIVFFDRVLRGEATLTDFIARHNEHRIVIPRLVFLLDLWLTGARNWINFAAILLCQAVHVVLFHRIIAARLADRTLQWTLTAVVTLLLFCIVQWENFYWGFQVQFVAVFLFFTIAAWSLYTAQERGSGQPRWHLIATGLLFGAAAPLTMSNGAVALLCIALVLLAARLFNRLTAVIALAALAVLLAYAAAYTPHPGHTPPDFAPKHPLLFIEYVAVYLGCVFAPLGLKFAGAAGLAGLALCALSGLALLSGRLERDRVNLTLLAILLFVVMTAMLTASGRLSFGVAQAVASRYATPSAIFWAAAVTFTVLWLLGGANTQRERALPALIMIAAFTGVSLIPITLAQREFRMASQDRRMNIQLGTDAILSRVHDAVAMKHLFPDPARMERDMIPKLQAHRLNIFARDETWLLGTQVPQDRVVAGRCAGHLDEIAALPGATDSFQLKGWAWDTAARRRFDRLVVLSPERRVVGFGSAGILRPDVSSAISGVGGERVGWAAYGREAPGQALSVYVLLDDGSLCRIGAAEAPRSPS